MGTTPTSPNGMTSIGINPTTGMTTNRIMTGRSGGTTMGTPRTRRGRTFKRTLFKRTKCRLGPKTRRPLFRTLYAGKKVLYTYSLIAPYRCAFYCDRVRFSCLRLVGMNKWLINSVVSYSRRLSRLCLSCPFEPKVGFFNGRSYRTGR